MRYFSKCATLTVTNYFSRAIFPQPWLIKWTISRRAARTHAAISDSWNRRAPARRLREFARRTDDKRLVFHTNRINITGRCDTLQKWHRPPRSGMARLILRVRRRLTTFIAFRCRTIYFWKCQNSVKNIFERCQWGRADFASIFGDFSANRPRTCAQEEELCVSRPMIHS